MREGSLEAPTRHPIDWQNPEYYDEEKIYAELERVFDICHGCRRCFNLCDSFPILFDLVDESKTGELDGVDRKDYAKVIDACTLCDMCFLTKCPYVPPHEFDLDFPHLMLRHRALEAKKGELSFADKQIAETDRNAKLAGPIAPVANWSTRTKNKFTRSIMQMTTGIDKRAELPTYSSASLEMIAAGDRPQVNKDAPAYGRRAVLYATCFTNFNDPDVGLDVRDILAKNGVETEIVHPHCCGMPMLEQGRLDKVAENARMVSEALIPWIDKGYDIITLVSSCALMVKFEWPLILPDDANVRKLAQATFDVAEYIVTIAKKEGMAPGIDPVPGGVSLHMACHSRAQNVGQKAAEMLRLIPEADVQVIERCSGHGGAWGFKKPNFDTAIKVGKPVARNVSKGGKAFVTSECPLAGVHIAQGIDALGSGAEKPELVKHPVQILARAYGIKR